MATVAFTSAFDIANFWAARSGAAILTGATEYRFQNAERVDNFVGWANSVRLDGSRLRG
jgi:hypothetical protein